jgi:hypothetical protein
MSCGAGAPRKQRSTARRQGEQMVVIDKAVKRVRRRVRARRQRRGSYVLQVPLSRCLNLGPLAFPCGPGHLDPLAATLVAYEEGRCSSYEGSPLEAFFERWQPQTMAEMVGLENAQVSESLLQPARGSTPPMPWSGSRGGANAQGRLQRSDLLAVAERVGVAPDELAGSIYQGPVSQAFGVVTFERIVAIHASIRDHGFRPGRRGRPHIDGRLLLRDGDHRVLVVSGKHRVAACSALDYPSLPVQFRPQKEPLIVRRQDARSWPNVVNGLYDVDQALELFDRMFDGEQPPGCPRDW